MPPGGSLFICAPPKVGHARNHSRTACFNERFLKQAILSSNKPGGEQVDTELAFSPAAALEGTHNVYKFTSKRLRGVTLV